MFLFLVVPYRAFFHLQVKLTSICDNLVLMQRSIASLVWEWNTDLQEFVTQQKKSEKTKNDAKVEAKITPKPGSVKGNADVVRDCFKNCVFS